MDRWRGFTLIELLVVVAIVSLLMSILAPCLNRGRELTRRAICAANQHGVVQGFSTYAGDNRQILPPTGYNDPPLGVQQTPNPYFWDMPMADKLVSQYLGRCEMVYCPSYLRNNQYIEWGNTRPDPKYGTNHDAAWWWYAWPEVTGYTTQWRIAGYNSMTQPSMGASRVKTLNDDPQKVLLFGMEISYNEQLSPTWGRNWEREHWGAAQPEGQISTCVDGHASWRSFNEMTANWSCGVWWWWWAK